MTHSGPAENSGVSKLAARFGGSTLAQQAARQALVNRARQQLTDAGSTGGASSPQFVCDESPAHSNQSTPQHSMPGMQQPNSNKHAAVTSNRPSYLGEAAAAEGSSSSHSSLHPAIAAEVGVADMDEILGVMAALSGPKTTHTIAAEAAHADGYLLPLEQSATASPASPSAAVVAQVPCSNPSPRRVRSITPDSSRIFKQPAQSAGQRKCGSKGVNMQSRTPSPLPRSATPSELQQHQPQQLQQSEGEWHNPIYKPNKQQQPAAAASPKAPAAAPATAAGSAQHAATASVQHAVHRMEHKGPQGKVQQGPAVAVKPAVFSFDEAHPVLAAQHYLRTHEQNRVLADKTRQAAAGQLHSRPSSASPTKQQLLQLQQQRPQSAATNQQRGQSHSGGGWHPNGPKCSSPVKRPQSAIPSTATALAVGSPAAAQDKSATLDMLGSDFDKFGSLDSGICGSPTKMGSSSAAPAATAYGAWASADPGGNASSSSSSSSSSRAVRDEQLRVLREAEQAMAVSQHLRTRQITHLPAASSSLKSSTAAATAAAAAAAAEALASRGSVMAGSRPGVEGWDRRWKTAAEAGQQQQQPEQQRAITELQQKMGCLQQGLAALLSGNPLPPAAAAALAAALQQTAAKAPAAAAAAGMSSRGEEIQDVISVINQPGAYQDPVQQRQQQQQQLLGTCDTNSSCIMAPVGKVSSASSAAAEAAAREAEIKLASGAYDAQRFEEYNRQVDADMARRAAESDYDSDLEDESAAAAAAAAAAGNDAAAALRELQEAERKLKQLADEEEKVRSTWAQQDEWMDEYRQQPHARGRTSNRQQQQQWQQDDDDYVDESASDADDEQEEEDQLWQQQQQQQAAARGIAAANAAARAGAARGHQAAATAAAVSNGNRRVLSPADEALLQKHFVPLISEEYPEYAVMADNMLQDVKTTDPQGLVSGYTSDGPAGYYSKAQRSRDLGTTAAAAAGSSGRARSVSPFRTTLMQPFNFERRAKTRPKTIAAVKLEQDLALKHLEQEAHISQKFTANPIPPSTLEPRYQMIIADQAEKRATAHAKYTSLLTAKETPFSFYCRDKAAAAAKAAKRAAARDPNRFQKPFKAKPVPAHVHETRYQATVAGLEAAKLAAKVRAEMAREKAAAKLQETYKRRQELAEAAYRERLDRSKEAAHRASASPTKQHPAAAAAAAAAESSNSSSATARSKSAPRSSGGGLSDTILSGDDDDIQRGNNRRSMSPGARLRALGVSGHVPNFAVLHAEWESQMAAKKAANKKRVTVPEEFHLNGSTPAEQAARAHKAAERKSRIQQQIQDDQYLLKELRWPFVSNRAPVHPTPPPAMYQSNNFNSSGSSTSLYAADQAGGALSPGGGGMSPQRGSHPVVGGTLAAHLRAEVVRQAMAEGKFDSKEERERKEWEATRSEQLRRQQQWQAMQAAEMHRRLAGQQHQQQTSSKQQLLDTHAAAAAGAAVAAAGGGSVLSAVEVAAHLDKLLSGKASITPMQPAAAAAGVRNSVGDYQYAAGPASPERVRRPGSAGSGSVRREASSPAAAAAAGRLSSSRPSSRQGGGSYAAKRSSLVQKRAELNGRVDAPIMHIEARHAQAEKAAREMIEEALLAQGIEAYRYVEG